MSHPQNPNGPSRRSLLKGGLAATAAAMLARPSLLEALSGEGRPLTSDLGPLTSKGRPQTSDLGPRTSNRPYLDVARKAERWLAGSVIDDPRGRAWPWDPTKPKEVQLNLYTGMPGVVLFYLELHHATGDKAALSEAMEGADYLIGTLPNEGEVKDAGLYTGLAGIAYTLELTHRASGEGRFRDGSARALKLVKQAARPTGRGAEWSVSTDIISGSAGIGLFLLWANAQMGDAESLQLALQAGKRLVERGQAERGGTKWLVSPQMTRNYPNFSHGAAGVSFFLATLHGATGEREFLAAAKAGAAYLDALATTTAKGGRVVFHSEPGNEQLFYLSWCHGPAGTARLYHRLAQVTGEATYRDRVGELAQATLDMRVPERSPGFWNNISQCCGNTGVSEFFVDLHRLTRNAEHLTFAERVSADTIQRGTEDGSGMKWIQAENRVSPDAVLAQTGFMQGASGVGLGMLHLDGVMEKRAPMVVLPDNPF